MTASILKFLRDEEGATAIEYGLIAGLIAVAIVASVTNVGTALVAKFTDIATKLGFVASPG